MGALEISKLKNQFVKDIANQCDVVKQDGILEGKELSIFKERTQNAIDCHILNKKDLVNDLMQVLGMDCDPTRAKAAMNIGKNVCDMLKGYTSSDEYYAVTQYINNLNQHTDAFMIGYQSWTSPWELCGASIDICEQIATEWFYDEKEQVLKTLCNKVLADADLYGDTTSSEYQTLKDIVTSKNIVKFAKRGVLDRCIAILISSFRINDDINSLMDKIDNK